MKFRSKLLALLAVTVVLSAASCDEPPSPPNAVASFGLALPVQGDTITDSAHSIIAEWVRSDSVEPGDSTGIVYMEVATPSDTVGTILREAFTRGTADTLADVLFPAPETQKHYRVCVTNYRVGTKPSDPTCDVLTVDGPPAPEPEPVAPPTPTNLTITPERFGSDSIVFTVTAKLAEDGLGPQTLGYSYGWPGGVREKIPGATTERLKVVVVPGPGETITYWFCARAYRDGLGSVESRCNSVKVSTPVPPSPIDSLRLKIGAILVLPSAVTLDTSEAINFCGFVQFGDGQIANRAPHREKCAEAYATFPESLRAVTAMQQAIADTVCLEWQAEGGTIEQEGCYLAGGASTEGISTLGMVLLGAAAIAAAGVAGYTYQKAGSSTA